MNPNDTQVVGGNPAGPVAGGLATEAPASNQEAKIAIRKYGYNMNAKEFEWRCMYLYISPFNNVLFNNVLFDYVQKCRSVINDVFTLPPAANNTVSAPPAGSA